jgi:hypothetical protein
MSNKRRVVNNLDCKGFEMFVRDAVASYTNRVERDDFVFPSDVYITWQCKTLQNWKALAATPLPDGRYFEATFNGNTNELYLDVYRKEANEVTKL